MMKNNFTIGYIETAIGNVTVVETKLRFSDIIGTVKVRWSISRNDYMVDPGLYAVGKPDKWSDVFVTANYKLSFDIVRKNLDGLNAWLLVLDTKGVNVWCAAGKRTFGTRELIFRVNALFLENIVEHRRLILPQLGAVGIAAHDVKKFTGFNVVYGPVRADDIKSFIGAGYKADKEMRRVRFTFNDRLKQIPVDFVYGKYYLLIAFALVFIISGLSKSGFSIDIAVSKGLIGILNIFLAYSAGIVFTPMLLPYIPFKSFSLKGFIMGLFTAIILFFANSLGSNILEIISWFFIIPCISSFIAMNFTGSSTFTSLSGVKKEMGIAIPVQIVAATIGLIGFIISKFL